MLLPWIASAQHPIDLYSPDSTICASISLTQNKTLSINITVDKQAFMTIDSIGWETDAGDCCAFDEWGEGCDGHSNDESYTLLWGENKTLCDPYHQAACCVYVHGQKASSAVCAEISVANDGISFRIRSNIPARWIRKEHTCYKLACDGTAWSIPANFASNEFLFREQPISQVTDASTPFTFELCNGLWGSIHEAGLESFPEMTLVRHDSLSFGTWLCPSADKKHQFAIPVQNEAPFPIQSSIRTILVGRSAKDLANAQFLTYINARPSHPSQSFPTEAIRPMKYIGIWWGMHLGINSWTPDERHGCTTANAIRHIDFAAAHNIDAVLLEGWNQGWENWGGSQQFDYLTPAPDVDIDSICRYAHRRGIEIIIHHETGGNWPEYERQLDTLFQWCRAHNIHAVKTGYAGGFPNQELHHSIVGVNHYNTVMRKAAEYGIMLDVHEPIKPTGLCFHYPNLMTGEGVRGQEWNAWSEGNPPNHHTILPFTRGLAGPMDYTPGIFDITYEKTKNDPNCRQWNQRHAKECRVHTTLAHQMALWVVLYSPWQMAADLIENYMMEDGSLHPMFQFFVDYDPDCDESRMLDGRPGQYVVTMRRAKERYFIGAITNETDRVVEIPLDFLPKGRKYTVTIYRDADNAHYMDNPTAWQIDRQKARSHDTLRVFLAPGGGCAIEIK